ncbi:MAG: TrkH family potassium uptake protein [Oscillospiraceae bacterium]|nr:TrkH family potassium uptake protein [Oscillospiraceae bacterium]
MNYRMIGQMLGRVLCMEAVLMLVPLFIALGYHESVVPFLISVVITGVVGFCLSRLQPKHSDFYAREGFVIVVMCWVVLSLLGTLPFVISGEIPRFIDALFETVSGFSTCGASILTDIEALSYSCLFWRSFTHWIGGMGVLVFIMAVMPMAGEYNMHIMRAEATGPVVGKLVPRVRKTAVILYLMYVILTLIETILLVLGPMNWFDAVLHAFSTAGTGGFSTRAASVGAFGSTYVDLVISIFMLLFGINFNLYFFLLIGKFKSFWKSEELRWYLGAIAFATITISLAIRTSYTIFGSALRDAFFQVLSIISTTGFATADFNQWPQYARWLLVLLMFSGACAGSTGGGMKVSRILILAKAAKAELRRLLHPRSVNLVQMDHKRVDESTVRCTLVFLVLYMGILLLGTLIVSLDGFDLETNFTAVLASLSSIGPGLSLVGATGNYAMFSWLSKLVLACCMLIGRLEIFPVMMFCAPRTWKRV